MTTNKKSKDFRNDAWELLRKDYWNPFLICLIFSVISGGLNFSVQFDFNFDGGDFITIPSGFWVLFSIGTVFSLALTIFVGGPMSYGYAKYFLLLVDNDSTKRTVGILFKGFDKRYFERVKLIALRTLYTFLWALLFIIPGIIKAIAYSQSFNIMADNDDLSANECLEKSKEMMNGHKMDYFILNLSFIGWYLLTILTFGIGALFLSPYVQTTNTIFYRYLKPGYSEYNPEAHATLVN